MHVRKCFAKLPPGRLIWDNIKMDLSQVGCEAVDNVKMRSIEFFVTLGCGRK
jgi:hypothetical protein